MSIGIALGTMAVVAAVIALGVVIDRRFSLLPRPGELRALDAPPPDPPGSTPAAALRVPAPRLSRVLSGQRCTSCKRRVTAGDGSPIRLGDHALAVYKLTCPACATSRALYVDVT
jgi:hypothetical protein